MDRQRDDTTALCEAKGWEPVAFYVDNDRSASNGKARPEWDRLLADIKAGEIDAIAVWNQDRGWRQMSELEDLRRFFTSLGRQIPLTTTLIGDVDLYDPYGVYAAQNRTAASELETAVMKIRMRRAAKQKAERGTPKWKRAFGYVIGEHTDECAPACTSHHHQLDPVTAPLVAEAYRMILAGSKLGEVCALFNDAGAHGLTGRPWNESTVSLFLRSPRNAALRAHNGEIVGKGTWPPLVSESTWRAVHAKMNAPHRLRVKTVRKHLLTGVLACGKCGGPLGGMQTVAKTISYRCKEPSCRGVGIAAHEVEPALYGIIAGRLAMPDAVDLLKAEIHDEAEADAVRQELQALYGELKNIGVERGKRLLTGEQASIATDIINADIAKLEARQQDSERMRVFEDIPLGTPEVADAIMALSPDRFRAVVTLLATITIAPVGKGGHTFRPERIGVAWKRPA